MTELYFNRFHIAEFSALSAEQKAAVKSMIHSNISIGSPQAMNRDLDLIGIFGDRTGLCLMDKEKPFGFIYANSAARGKYGRVLKIDYAICPISRSKKDFVKLGTKSRIDPMLELTKGAILWGIERDCKEVMGAEPISKQGGKLLSKIISKEYISAKSKLILKERFESHWEEAEGHYERSHGKEEGRHSQHDAFSAEDRYDSRDEARYEDRAQERDYYDGDYKERSIGGIHFDFWPLNLAGGGRSSSNKKPRPKKGPTVKANRIRIEAFLISNMTDPLIGERARTQIRVRPSILRHLNLYSVKGPISDKMLVDLIKRKKQALVKAGLVSKTSKAKRQIQRAPKPKRYPGHL